MTGSTDRNNSDSSPTDVDVALLGCGNMGSAMVRALLKSGRRVAAWNRTAARAEALVAEGAVAMPSAGEAMTAAPVVILCVSTTEDARGLLDNAPDLAGRTLINMTSGTPEDAGRLHTWAQEHGVPYLDAAIGAYPEQLGTPEAIISVAGDEELFKAHEDLILAIAGSSFYVGPDYGAANAIDAAMTGSFYISSFVCYLEAVRFAREFGVSHDVIASLSSYSVSVLDHQIKLALDRLAANDFTTDQATLNVYADALTAFTAGLNTRGPAPMAEAATRLMRQAVDAGLGDQDIAAAVTVRL